jgi:hypothetical protein
MLDLAQCPWMGWHVLLSRQARGEVSFRSPILIACLVSAHVVSGYLVAFPFRRLVEESFLILGWVANWRPLEIFLYDWWPLVRRRDLYRRLAEAAVETQAISGRPVANTHGWPSMTTAMSYPTKVVTPDLAISGTVGLPSWLAAISVSHPCVGAGSLATARLKRGGRDSASAPRASKAPCRRSQKSHPQKQQRERLRASPQERKSRRIRSEMLPLDRVRQHLKRRKR